ncbi:MAG TPA: hypothetical protein VH475_28155, partial [Tepidisphaeraceae bacterium]
AVCKALRIDPRTLYNWRHHNPLFIAEFNRRQQELWDDTASHVRRVVAAATDRIRYLLLVADYTSQIRAARVLLSLVNSPRLAPTGPMRLDRVLDQLLDARGGRADDQAPAYTDAQRQHLFDQLMAQDDPDPAPPPTLARRKRPAATADSETPPAASTAAQPES